MQKRGQVSIFVIIGLVLIAVLVIFFFLRESLVDAIRQTPTNTQEYLGTQLEDIKDEVGRCVVQETAKASRELMANGGNFERNIGVLSYDGIDYPVLCVEFENGNGCLAQNLL